MIKYIFWLSFLFPGLQCGYVVAQSLQEDSEGSCSNPFRIKDSVLTVQLKSNDTGKVWLSFTSSKNSQLIEVTDDKGQPCNYLIFRYSGTGFCKEISEKKLIPERNRVCNKDIAYDAATSLSFENIDRGLCKCAYCCHMLANFYTIPGETYYIVVYTPGLSVTVNLGAVPAKYTMYEPAKEPVQQAEKKQPQTFSGNTRIENLQVGQSLTLENIYFEGGTASFLPISYDALEGLLDFLQKNPTVKIEIQGHVNGPNQPPDINYSNNLGYRRARAVYDYLVNRKTDKERLSCKGFGNTQMVYPNAVIEPEMAKNRRVEIVIVSK